MPCGGAILLGSLVGDLSCVCSLRRLSPAAARSAIARDLWSLTVCRSATALASPSALAVDAARRTVVRSPVWFGARSRRCRLTALSLWRRAVSRTMTRCATCSRLARCYRGLDCRWGSSGWLRPAAYALPGRLAAVGVGGPRFWPGHPPRPSFSFQWPRLAATVYTYIIGLPYALIKRNRQAS